MPDSSRAIVRPLNAAVSGCVTVPGSKSLTNRAIVLALAARGTSVLRRPLRSDDTRHGATVARALGATAIDKDDTISITGLGALRPVDHAELHVGSAGTIARFLPCFLAFGGPGEWTLTASEQMTRRPMAGLFAALESFPGALTALGEPDRYPLRVRGGGRVPAAIEVDGGVSSQYLSGLLLSAPLLDRDVTVRARGAVVQGAYVDMTVDSLRRFGATVERSADRRSITVHAGPTSATDLEIEADASTASYFAALPAILGGSIRLPNVVRASRQPDTRFLEILERFGCETVWDDGGRGLTVTRPGDLDRLRGGARLDLNDCSDVALTTAALAVFADAPTEIVGVEHIRQHECDRIDALTAALTAFGIEVEERPDGWLIHPGTPRSAEIGTRDDHRVAMSTALVALGGAGAALDHPRSVDKTCPEFWDLLAGVGADVELIAGPERSRPTGP
ncbi:MULTISPECIES: 3-phosphoshikimate 1-carboxyvinyltransferase [unclassified Rathayibacter]|uniref:3-phosphoshikimate 1-carboxyvinyltransferase n=1 Tax=unclassified Rathayibacter TaxID=2609250 RepID=UPI000FA8E204|nr:MULTISPECIES: 3-phosphoshikimate 1-carboxyvinyltransferase [unclassified Rathayibacter]ROP45119.1 3-phosphoshikimate 1-carboxyvinyltransferase [Rathayibacter sp. PhB186]ROS47844.1 3-phosphoshikimate 1-carboxyvinyltransferase [Rathayibacter sp. PhB185]